MIPKVQRVLWVSIVFVASVATAHGVRADTIPERVPSNLDLMTRLTTDVVEELMDAIEGDRAGRGIHLQPYANNEDYRFIGSVITSVLTARGVTVYQTGATVDAADSFDLQFQAMEFSVVYPSVFRSHLIGGKRVRRIAAVKLLTTLVNPGSASVIRVDEAARDSDDQFPRAALGHVERGTVDFVHPEVPGSGWGRAVEPVFVSGIIVGLIYLFFANQSDN